VIIVVILLMICL